MALFGTHQTKPNSQGQKITKYLRANKENMVKFLMHNMDIMFLALQKTTKHHILNNHFFTRT